MATITDAPDRTSTREMETLRGRARNLTVTVIVLAVALLGLGAWVTYDYYANRDTAVSGDVTTLLDDYTAAWNNHDSEAFLELVTDDYTFSSDVMFGTEPIYTTAEGQAMLIGAVGDFNVEVIGEPIMTGNGPWYVAQVNRVGSESDLSDGISNFVIVDEGGTLLVASHIWTGN